MGASYLYRGSIGSHAWYLVAIDAFGAACTFSKPKELSIDRLRTSTLGPQSG